ncbi:Ima1 N-terminal domain-containing protein [Xylariaceae sp. FL0662B]|nr:Ima1 N-terminal domain-containing protein [Xylariaceae sp. FL0662B]
MATLWSRKNLSCFYCGRRSKLRFEGQKSFVCSICDATNWLDEHGDITDPPSATSSIDRIQVQYAVPRSAGVRSPSPLLPPDRTSSEEPVFCTTCLRNQHMLTSSLAQFEWPDDVSSAEYAVRERKYFALRKDLEKRYPQMCNKCMPKVEKKLHEASYNAQTDHLRRMMARTRSQRREVKRRGVLDAIDLTAKWSWHLGFTLQFVWHTVMVCSLVIGWYSMGEGKSWMTSILKNVQQIGQDRLPHVDQAMQWAVNLGMCSFPWNPRFKQTIRGFTAHILGFRQWYTYQLLILLMRFVCLSMAQYGASKGLPAAAQLGAQLVVAALTGHVYRAARKSIHTDTTPLFRQKPSVISEQVSPAGSASKNDSNDLGNILDEILDSPSETRAGASSNSPGSSAYHTNSTNTNLLANSYDRLGESSFATSKIGSLNLSSPMQVERPAPQITHYDEEMDWSPSASQHRAFSSYNPYRVKNMNPRFSDAPIEPKSGPFWYKVPQAPISPAQKLRNPPMRPIIRESPKEKKENFFQSTARGPVDIGSPGPGSSSNINFADPKFYAPEPKDDPRDNLSNMFASSFSISPDPDEERTRNARIATNNYAPVNSGYDKSGIQNRSMERVGEFVVLIGALYVWVLALGTEEQYGRTLALASICACLIVSIRLAADLQVDAQIREGKQPSVFTVSWATVGMIQVIAALILLWNIWSGSAAGISRGAYGNGLFAIVIAHQMWHIFV